MKHHMTKYRTGYKAFAESWFQINIFGKQFCFFDKTIEL